MCCAPPEADPQAWLAKADGDLEVAERISEVSHLAWAAGFHLQQAAEKALKAALLAHGRLPPRAHDLKALADEVAMVIPSLGGWDARLVILNEYSVLERYPTATVFELDLEPLRAEVRELVEAVRQAVSALRPDAT